MMKILESYKKMAKSMLTELAWDRKFGEPLPTLEDTTKKHQTEAEEVNPDKVIGKNDKGKAITVQMAMDYSGDNETMNTLKKKAQDVKPTDGEEEPKGKGLGPDDFERDFDDDSETGKDYVSKFQGTDEPEDDEYAISGTDSDDPAGGKGDAWMTGKDKGMEKRPGGEQAEKDYQKADQMIKKFAGVDIEKAEYWAKKKKQAADAMMGEITVDGKKYKPITESIKPKIYDPYREIKKQFKRVSLRQFDRKWQK